MTKLITLLFVVATCLMIAAFGSQQLVLIAKIAIPGFILGYVSQKTVAYVKSLRFDGLLKDLRYAKMRYDLRKSIKL